MGILFPHDPGKIGAVTGFFPQKFTAHNFAYEKPGKRFFATVVFGFQIL